MKKRWFMWAILLLIVQFADAQQISQLDAQDRARKFITSSRGAKGRSQAPASAVLDLAYVSEQNGEIHYYVFNSPNMSPEGGFVIIGGDETARTVLGYSTHGAFNYDSIPDNVRYWLSIYDEQISRGIAAAAPRKTAPVAKPTIANLLTTTWNQDDPYNSELPSLGAGYTGNYALATGCVATAMAQVMKYHSYPTHGIGSNSYTGINNLTFEADFANTTYDWANMLDSYGGNYTSTQAAAVGTLMYHAGVAVNMSYGQITSGGSGANSYNIPVALIENFGYDKGAGIKRRVGYTDEEWEQMIYDELAASHPIIYSASSDEGGHAFVCHGYDADYDYYAFNWGWGGYCDGYYPMSGTYALTPDGTGIGGSSSGSSYTKNQMAVFGVMPDEGNGYSLSVACNASFVMSTSNDTSNAISSYNLNRASSNEATLYMITSPMNLTPTSMAFQTAVRLTETTTGRTYYGGVQSLPSLLYSSYYIDVPSGFSTSLLPYNGTYMVEPVYRPSGSTSEDDWELMRYDITTTVPTIVVTGGVDDQPIDVEFTLSDNTIQVARTATINHSKTYNGTITYTSSNPSVATVDGNGVITGVSMGTATITASASATVAYNATVKQFVVSVVATQKDPITYTISGTSLSVGETATISAPAGYLGTTTYASSAPSVATVSATGVVTAVSAGTATITVIGTPTDTFSGTAQTFLVTVSEALPEELLVSSVSFPYGDLASSTNGVMTIVLLNNTSAAYTGTIYMRLVLNNVAVNSSCPLSNFSAGAQGTITMNVANYTSYMTVGNSYSMYFYCDEAHTQLMSSYNFTWCNEGTIEYELTDAGYGTICLPFPAEVPSGLTAYESNSMDDEGRVILTRASSLAKDTPYILVGTPGDYEFTGPLNPSDLGTYTKGMLTGVTSNNYSLQVGDCVLQAQGGVTGFYNVTPIAGATFTQYRAFLNSPSVFRVTSKSGDMDGDFVVDDSDISALTDAILSHATYSAGRDLNGDNTVDVGDITAGVNLILNPDNSSVTTYGSRVAAYSQKAAVSGAGL